MTSPDPATSVAAASEASVAARFPTLRRLSGGLWFGFLAYFYALAFSPLVVGLRLTHGSFEAWAALLSRVCVVIFMLTLAWLMMVRPMPVAQKQSPLTWAVALLGTYGVWVVGFLPQSALSPALNIVAGQLTLVGSILTVYAVLYLGRSFSISPQARVLRTKGPYGLIRHPLYAAEELALIGLALHSVWWAGAPVLIAHVALQIRRMGYEESVLRQAFPEYDAYAARTARWIPGLW